MLGPVKANEARTTLPAELSHTDLTRWEHLPATGRDQFAHCITGHIDHAFQLLYDGTVATRGSLRGVVLTTGQTFLTGFGALFPADCTLRPTASLEN